MTEEDVRRIVREEIQRALAPRHIASPNLPDAFPIQTLPMPKFDYPAPTYHPPVSSRSPMYPPPPPPPPSRGVR